MALDIPKSTSPIKVPATRFKSAVSESILQAMAGAINHLLDAIPVGTIWPSMLTEAQFQAIQGTGWILADGRGVGGSRYETITGLTVAPDLRGVFPRGKNHGRSTSLGDADGERALGSYQAHAIMQIGSLTGYEGQALVLDVGNGFIESSAGEDFRLVNIANSNFGGPEVRPRNVCVNYFIRID